MSPEHKSASRDQVGRAHSSVFLFPATVKLERLAASLVTPANYSANKKLTKASISLNPGSTNTGKYNFYSSRLYYGEIAISPADKKTGFEIRLSPLSLFHL